MTERSRFWDGTATGDATIAPYDAGTEFAQVLMSISQANGIPTDRSYVFTDELNELVPTGAASPVSIGTGRALVYGNWYENDSAVSVVIPTPAASTRIDRIVARKGWAAQTVRITRIAGTEGGGAPAITQTAGTTWDMPICQASITTGGVITITDERDFLTTSREIVPCARAYHNVSQSIANSTITVLALNSEDFDTNGFHSTTSRMTIPSDMAGVYLIIANMQWAANTTGLRQCFILLNGANQIAKSEMEPATTGFTTHALSTIYNAAVGDYFEIQVQQASGGPLDARGDAPAAPMLQIVRLGTLS